MNLEEALAKALKPLFDSLPVGEVLEVDSIDHKHVTLHIQAPDGTEETWCLMFRVGEQLEFARIG